MDVSTLQASRTCVRLFDRTVSDETQIEVSRIWNGNLCRSVVTNRGTQPVRLSEIVLFAGTMDLTPTTSFYGEAYQTLSQTVGTLAAPVDVSRYSDHAHYRMLATPGMITAYNAVLLSEQPDAHTLLAFTSCRRFSGMFRLNPTYYEIALDMEGLTLGAQETWELEEFCCLTGADSNELFADLARHIAQHHPLLLTTTIPTGWCSWYYYGAHVSEQDIFDNMQAIAHQELPLTYIQIDDGFQSAMGDWLIPGSLFPLGIQRLCQQISEQGYEPAIWVAPFIAEQEAQILHEHPDWFVHDEHSEPLPSNRVSFGGWRRGPWYMLDGTHPQVQEHLENLFRTMRQEWNCHYFKLDALMWGALHGGYHYDRSATRIEAYRRGMKAILRGAGTDSFILGCNAPIWPSLGLVHGMRVSGDIARSWEIISSVARECFLRNWQHNRLWINDPDCVVLENKPSSQIAPDGSKKVRPPATADEFLFHATAIYATGGMVLAGDKMESLPADKQELLRKLLPPTSRAARFDDVTCRIGRIQFTDHLKLCLFNWNNEPDDFVIELPGLYDISDYWTGEQLGQYNGQVHLTGVPAHSARLLVCLPSQ
jgi:alpha-galactosidase